MQNNKILIVTLWLQMVCSVVFSQQTIENISGTYNFNITRGSKPTITWQTPSSQSGTVSASSSYTIKACLKSSSALQTVKVYVNYSEQSSDRGFVSVSYDNCDFVVERSITLTAGQNAVYIVATNSTGSTTSETRYITLQNTPPPPPPPTQKRLALVIGNQNYSSGGILANPVSDARTMASALQELGFTVLKYENLGGTAMIQAINDFGTKLPNYQVALFYYAGHGIQLESKNFLVPTDANLQYEADVETNCVDVNRVLAKMEGAKTLTNIVILDACRNNPWERAWAGRSVNGNGLAFMNAPQGTLIAYSTSPNKTASDDIGYASELARFMKTPGITLEEVFKKTGESVQTRSNRTQVPWFSTSFYGNFYFKQ